MVLSSYRSAGVAQLIERRLAKAKVVGLSPITRSKFLKLVRPNWQFPNNPKYLTTLRESGRSLVFISRNFVIFQSSLAKCLPASSFE